MLNVSFLFINFYKLTHSESIAYEASKFPRINLHLLHVAAYYDSLECFLFIFNKGFSPYIRSPDDYSPIHYACYGGATEVASFLCTPDFIDLNNLKYSPPGSKYTPIFLATLSKSPEILQLLFDSGVTIPQMDPLSRAPHPIGQAIQCKDYECLSILLSNTNTQKIDEKNFNPLMKAISNNFTEAVKILVEHGADISYTTPDMKNALFLACFIKNEELVRYLLENGADATQKGYLGQYPIHWAAMSDNVNIVKLVLAYGADPNVLDNRGRPPTFSAIGSDKNRDQIIKILLDAGCNPNAVQRNTGSTILYSLLPMEGTTSVLNSVKFILEKGGDLNHAGKNKITLYQFAKRICKPEVMKVIDDFLHDHPEIKVK